MSICLRCKSNNTIKKGFRRNRYSKKQRYHCRECGFTFVEDDGFKCIHYPVRIIVKAIFLVIVSMSLAKTSEYLWQHEKIRVPASTIHSWIMKYSTLLVKIHLHVRPLLKGRQHYDEKYIKVKGKSCYDLNCIDHITKYIIAHLFVGKRTFQKCVAFLKQIKLTCYDQILARYQKEKHKPVKKRKLFRFVCDGFENYRKAWSKLFYRVSNITSGVPIKAKNKGLKHNNNHIERENGSIKDRIKTMRGGFGSYEGAEAFLNLRHIMHNFVIPHQSLNGKTPAEAAGIDLGLGNNKLLDLIKYTVKNV